MSVPPDDMLCRFVRPADWSTRDSRPKPGAFKQPELSVWNCDKLRERGVQLDELRIEHLGGHGQAHHTAGDYEAYARQSSLAVQVVWRPGDQYVGEPWRQWNYAPRPSRGNLRTRAIHTSLPRFARDQLPVRCRS